MTGKPTEAEERVRRLRQLAEEVRTAGEGMKYPEARSAMLRIAQNYERLADTLDNLSSSHGKSSTGT